MVSVAAAGVSFSYGSQPVLRDVNVPPLPAGSVTALVGPNAAGKSTLLKCIAGLLRHRGRITLDGADVSSLPRREVARRVSFLPQDVPVHAVLTVFEAVLLAQRPPGAWRVGRDAPARVEDVLRRLGLEDLALRYLNELSGGQRQLVSIAQALARPARVLLLDEPTGSLDLQRQLEVLALVRRHATERAVTAIVSIHDLNLAGRHAERVVVLHRGGVYAAGPPAEVLTAAMLGDVYGVDARVGVDGDGHPQVTALASRREAGGDLDLTTTAMEEAFQ